MADAFKLIIEDDEGKRNVVPVSLGEVTVGRHEGNAIRLNERNVSRQHMRLVKDNGHVFAEDLDSYNGVFINGSRISERQPVHEGDLIRVGDFHLELRGEGLARRAEETTQKTLVPDLDSTQPEIRVPEEKTEVGAKALPDAQTPAPAVRAPEPVDDDEDNRAEPTAIIRLDQLQALEGEKREPAAAIRGERPKLLCVSTNFAGSVYEITTAEAVIGRTDDNDIAIDHRSVSRNHAKIVTNGNSYKIIDLGSANGTLVNGEQYVQLSLKAGDLIELGHVKFRFIPPGSSYTPSDSERAAMDGTPPPTTPTTGPTTKDVPTNVRGLWAHIQHNPLQAITAGAVLVGVIVFLIWLFTPTSAVPVADEMAGELGEEEAAAIEADDIGGSVDKMIARAKELMDERQWKKAEKHLMRVVEKDPTHEEALALLETIEMELGAKKSFDAANRSIKQSVWEDAWHLLGEIPEESVYFEDAGGLREQVRGALITERINDARTALDEGKTSQAAEIIDEIESLDAENEQLAGLRDELSDAKGDRSAKTRPPPASRATPREEPAKVTPDKGKKKNGSKPPVVKEPVPPAPVAAAAAPAAPGGDAKSYYKKGIDALQAGDTQKAIDAFSKCAQVDRSYCLCYRAMGISYARAGNGPKAARYYRLYLKYCPAAKDAAQVKKLLEAYGQ